MLVLQLTQVAVVTSAAVSSEHNSRTVAEMLSSSNLEVIATTLAASGPPLRLLDRNHGMSSSCEPLVLKRLMKTDDKFLLLHLYLETQKV